MSTIDGFTAFPPRRPAPVRTTATDILVAGLLGIPPDTLLIDGRDPDPTREGVFRDHNCYRCDSGVKPCVAGNPRQCEYPRARND